MRRYSSHIAEEGRHTDYLIAIDPAFLRRLTRSSSAIVAALIKRFFLFSFSKKKTKEKKNNLSCKNIEECKSARVLSRKIITAFIRIEFIPWIPYVPPHLYPPLTPPLLLSGVKKISLTVGQTDGWVSCRSYTASVSRDDVPERGS